ncbi:MAG: 2,3-epoxybenzoyl-CoA dihydrolase [Acidobacteriota bacterium]
MLSVMAETATTQEPIVFETHPDRYRHWQLSVDGPVATLKMNVQEDGGLRPGYELKLNSYDLGVDIELADAVQRLRFEHPEVSAVLVTSAQDGVFSAGANIFMLGSSTHAFKVNFCKFTNETRLGLEDSTENSGQTYIAGLNGVASGGGYELPLACKEMYLVDDRRSAVALPEVPYLGVLPGTGGLTRVVDKRLVRKDLADVFCTLAEGIKGKRAVQWGLVDGVFPSSKFVEKVDERVREVAGDGHADRKGITLAPVTPEEGEGGFAYRHVTLDWGPVDRAAELTINLPDSLPELPADGAAELGADWWPLRAFRELDDALLRLRFNHPDIGLVLLRARGSAEVARQLDSQLADSRANDWFVDAVVHNIKRVLKRLDVTAKSFFAVADEGSCFTGTLLELALASDRTFVLEADGVALQTTATNDGFYPMGNGLTRMATRFLANPEHAQTLLAREEPVPADETEDEGLATLAMDDIDWDDELRLAIEERVSLSPDSLTGLEANLRFAGPETLETKIFGRLSAWQNWIFQRPNAVGKGGALTLYGRPESPEFDYNRT